MRALMVVFALVATPFAVGASQGQPLTGDGAVKASKDNKDQDKDARDAAHQALEAQRKADHQALEEQKRAAHLAAHCAKELAKHPDKQFKKCPAPGDGGGTGGTGGDPGGGTGGTGGDPGGGTGGTGGTCGNGAVGLGTGTIDGQVFVDADPWPGLSGWCVHLSGPVSASVLTDASGNYLFSGLPAGTYTVCEELQAGWTETFPTSGPTCSPSLGYDVVLTDGAGAGFIWFGNIQ